jgi:hypothetical protein
MKFCGCGALSFFTVAACLDAQANYVVLNGVIIDPQHLATPYATVKGKASGLSFVAAAATSVTISAFAPTFNSLVHNSTHACIRRL